jgi:hypothetical protein
MLAIHWIAMRGYRTRGLVERTTFPKDSLPEAMANAQAIFDQVRVMHPDGAPNGAGQRLQGDWSLLSSARV